MSSQIVTLHEARSGASASILVSQGFNCFRWTVPLGGRPLELIYAPDDFADGAGRPSRGGIPLLFPFPGRIPGTTLSWQGQQYALEPGDALGNAIHGFVLSRPWRVVEASPQRVVGEFDSHRDDPGLAARWPSAFRFQATYTLAGQSLRCELVAENTGKEPLPCGLGAHPYFRLPLGGPSAEACLVRLPVAERWELENLLPTGRKMIEPDARALAAGKPFADLRLDDVFSGLGFEGGACTTSIHDPGSGCTLVQRFGAPFRECVVYTPPHREAICIEPYTCVAGAFALQGRGIDTGLLVLPPGETLRAWFELAVRLDAAAAK